MIAAASSSNNQSPQSEAIESDPAVSVFPDVTKNEILVGKQVPDFIGVICNSLPTGQLYNEGSDAFSFASLHGNLLKLIQMAL